MSYLDEDFPNSKFLALYMLFVILCSIVIYIYLPNVFWWVLVPLGIAIVITVVLWIIFIKWFWYGYDKKLTIGEVWNLRFSKPFEPEIEFKSNDNQKKKKKNVK